MKKKRKYPKNRKKAISQMPPDWWNYGFNPILGTKVKNAWSSEIRTNSYPNPVKDER